MATYKKLDNNGWVGVGGVDAVGNRRRPVFLPNLVTKEL